MSNAIIYLVSISSLIVCIALIAYFIYRLLKYGFVGKKLLYLATTYILCYFFSLINNLNPAIIKKPYDGLVGAAISFWDALKMMTLSFKGETITKIFYVQGWGPLYATSYVIVSAIGAAFISLSVIMLFVKTATVGFKNTFKIWFTKQDVYFILSDPKVSIAKTMGNELKKDNIVIMILTSGSQKTQEGTEYKDSLVGQRFEVWTENYTSKFASYLFQKRSFLWSKHKKIVMGLFSDDDISSNLGLAFKEAILNDKKFLAIKNRNQDQPLTNKEEKFINDFKVYITYHGSDFDITHGLSKETLHIVNTLSEYNMISTNFVLDNPIYNFVGFEELKNDKELAYDDHFHVTFLGFGKINKPIFNKMTSAYQLWGDNKYKVKYHILDKDVSMVSSYDEEFFNPKAPSKNDKLDIPYMFSVDSKEVNFSNSDSLNNYVKDVSKESSRFNKKGFEIFVISVSSTYFDIKIARQLRLNLLSTLEEERLKRTLIFVRISDNEKSKGFVLNNSDIALTQEEISKGYLLCDGNNKLCPIVPFGDNAMMSDFIKYKFPFLDKIGLGVSAAYEKDLDDPKKQEWNWLNKSKIDMLDNTSNAWGIQNSYKLLGFNLGSDFQITDEKDEAVANESFDKKINELLLDRPCSFKECDETIRLIAEMEHNRWLATQCSTKRYALLSLDDFISLNKDNAGNYFSTGRPVTKNIYRTKHVCMTSNKGLETIYQTIVEKGKTEAAIKQAEDLVFWNDINQIRTVFKSLRRDDQPSNK